jgi:hypothetical protein
VARNLLLSQQGQLQAPEIRRGSEFVENIDYLIGALRVIAIACAFGAFAWALGRMRRESAEELGKLAAAQQRTQADVQALTEKVSALATLVAAIPARVERPVEAPPAPRRREPSASRSYETARRLARAGATVSEIVATSGVPDTEARLLQRLHGGVGTAGEDAA